MVCYTILYYIILNPKPEISNWTSFKALGRCLMRSKLGSSLEASFKLHPRKGEWRLKDLLGESSSSDCMRHSSRG